MAEHKGAAYGQILTKPLKLATPDLRLNAKCDFGKILVEVMDADGKILTRSNPLQADGLDLGVQWNAPFQLPSAPVRLRLTLENARLFALWCGHLPGSGQP